MCSSLSSYINFSPQLSPSLTPYCTLSPLQAVYPYLSTCVHLYRHTLTLSPPFPPLTQYCALSPPQAVIAELLLRQVTRESLQLAACVLCWSGSGATSSAPAAPDDDSMEQDAPAAGTGTVARATVTAAGLAALRCPQLARPLLTLVFR